MKLSECRPCDKCGKKISPIFYVIRFSQALFTPAANRTLGMIQYMGGNVALGEEFAPESDDAVLVLGDKQKELMTELFICQPCFLMGALDLASIWEKRSDQIKAEAEKHEAKLKGKEPSDGE
jgi:hypothetical protein